MVKARKVGKRRAFWRGFFLTVITFGIYGIYWNYKAHHEVFSQFDLDDEGRDEGLVWLILGLLFTPIIWIYQHGFVKNVNYVRQRLGMSPGISPRAFLTLVILGVALTVVMSVVLQIVLVAMAGDGTDPATGEPEPDIDLGVLVTLLLGLFASLAVGVVLSAIAYAKLQRAINDVWDAFDRRMSELTAPRPPTAPAPPSAAAPARPPASPPARPP